MWKSHMWHPRTGSSVPSPSMISLLGKPLFCPPLVSSHASDPVAYNEAWGPHLNVSFTAWPLLHCCSLKKTLLFDLEWILGWLLLLYFPLRVQFQIMRGEQVQFHPGSTSESTNNWALLCYVLSHISQCPVLNDLLCASGGACSHNHVMQ